ncbi:hypothetical protein V8E36_004066 [Tilletia maclaganii]
MAATRRAVSQLNFRPYQVLAIGSLAAVVILGSTYASLSGSTRFNLFFSDPIRFPDAVTASKPVTLFADRRNWLNVLFVKKVWGWTTLAFLGQAVVLRRPWSKLLLRAKGTTEPGADDPLVASILRFVIATTAWVFFASWFLGPSIADRTFLLTGGSCHLDIGGKTSIRVPAEFCRARSRVSLESHPQLFQVEGFNLGEHDSSTLKNLAPRFRGGIDMSGHTFLLTLSILFLLEEIMPFVPYLLLRVPTPIRPTKALIEALIPRAQWASFDPFHAQPSPAERGAGNGSSSSSSSAANPPPLLSVDGILAALSKKHVQAQLVAGGVLAHIGLSVWMLLMTQLYFHTLGEKLAGLVVGVLSWVALPKDGIRPSVATGVKVR